MLPLLLLVLLLSLVQLNLGDDRPNFTRPSEAYEYARLPVTEWEAAIQAHKTPSTRVRPDEVTRPN
jgi:hypothetical protein